MRSKKYIMKNSQVGLSLKLLTLSTLIAFATSCTKTRKAELPDDQQANVFAISEFGTTTDNSQFSAQTSSTNDSGQNLSVKAIDQSASVKLSSDDVNVPARLKFMFDKLPLASQSNSQFKITFAVDKDYVTAYKVATSVRDLTVLEKALAITLKEVQLITQVQKSTAAQTKVLLTTQNNAAIERNEIKNGKKEGSLLVPLFKYKIEGYGVLERTKNELKESTSVLTLKKTDWQNATHIQITSSADTRLLIGMNADQVKDINQLYNEGKIDNRVLTAEELQSQLKINMKFIDSSATVFTRLDQTVLHIYEITKKSALNENQLRLLKNNAGNQEVISCQDATIANYLQSKDADCVVLLKANIPVAYKSAKLALTDMNGNTSNSIDLQDVPRSQSVGLVQILENSAAKQVDISGTLDPNSAVKISDLAGEFFYRRTFESASNMFLGRTGTSGDMTIIKFELEDQRIVVRNQQSLITYTGQGPKDREELMSFPVKYIRLNKIAEDGSALTIPAAEVTTKEKAEYAIIDWTANTIPDSNSPLAFYSGGDCFMKNSALRVTDTDMRLATDGVLNYSLSGSYTVKPQAGCYVVKDVNSSYWGGTYQWNFNISERISFVKHKNTNSDIQFTQNISGMAQAAFNYGVFTLADKVTETDALDNRDGSEKYMPLVHDFRNGRKIKYYIGGLNNPEATSAERRQLIIDASKQVIDEWNKTLRYAFKGTSLERSGDYVDIVVDEGENTGHLGDLDRNYIWFQELQAENGLLGVAQPAANPRSGTIESANVIIYSGNTFDQARRLIKMTQLSRDYEKMIEQYKTKALAEAQKQNESINTADAIAQDETAAAVENGTANKATVERTQFRAQRLNKTLIQSIKALQLDNQKIKNALKGMRTNKINSFAVKTLTSDLFKDQIKGQKIDYAVNENTFLKKLTELAVDKKITSDSHQFELAVNSAFIQFGGIDESMKAALQKRSELLAAVIKFDENTKNRPGCYLYERNDIEDEALSLDSDPTKNLMKNFKLSIMSTLSHELGHAFGLLHNFKASTDKANYEFEGEKTGRNYSSIMDYIADIDLKYAGPGPYDAHALRAAYTGMIEISDVALKNPTFAQKLKITNGNLVDISDLTKALGAQSFVHLTKETLNKAGVLKFYEQCDDGGLSNSSMCAQFDSGASATEIVKNKIADYNRGYISRNYVYDKILFGWPQKVQVIQRNITLFQQIRSFLDEAVMTAIYGAGRTKAENQAILQDQANAAKLGYMFFQELLRTPDASGTKLSDFAKRIRAIPYEYQIAKADDSGNVTSTESVKDIKILEARSIYDVNMTQEKINTIGIGYDKIFAMQFLLQSTAAQTNDDSRVSQISYLDFEQWFLGVSDPTQSKTLSTILDILGNQLKTGFFAPSKSIDDLQFIETDIPVEINRNLGLKTAVASVIGLAESKWKGFDPFADSFKVARSTVKNSPADRFSVVKAGQDRRLSDSRVYFAAQNGVAANALIRSAAAAEFFITNKANFFKLFKDLYTADLAYRKPIADIIAKACVTNEAGEIADASACQAAQDKPLDQYLKESTELAAAKANANEIAKNLVNTLRQSNSKELLMPKDLDKSESATNFERQVEVLRSMISSQINLVVEIKGLLESSSPNQLQDTITAVVQTLQKAKAKNAQLQQITLLDLGQVFISEVISTFKVKLPGEGAQEVPGSVLADMLIDKNHLKDTYDKQTEVIEQLANYSGLVDPDTIGQ